MSRVPEPEPESEQPASLTTLSYTACPLGQSRGSAGTMVPELMMAPRNRGLPL